MKILLVDGRSTPLATTLAITLQRALAREPLHVEPPPPPPPARRSKQFLGLTMALAALGCESPLPGIRDKACTHSFGLAGGFSSCSACGINPRYRRGP